MAVEIAKESSDMFLPLKAVVGALAVLIKNYDVSLKVSRSYLLPRISIANRCQCRTDHGNREEGAVTCRGTHSPGGWPGQSREDAERDSAKVRPPLPNQIPVHNSTTVIVCRKLVEITEKLGPLSEQHGLRKFLKNVDYAIALNGFVQDLGYAISDYQVCVQKSITRNN